MAGLLEGKVSPVTGAAPGMGRTRGGPGRLRQGGALW